VFIAPKLLWPRRGRWFFSFLFSTFRLSLALAMIGCRRRATLLPLQRLLRLLVLLWLRPRSLHSFLLGARFIRICSTSRRRDLLIKSGRWTAARLALSSCAHRWRCAEPLTLKSSLVTLRRSLSCASMRGIWLLTWSSRWLATRLLLLLLLRGCTLET
jgi:hypothetical protein